MTITEYAELDKQVKELESKIDECVRELNVIKSKMTEFSGTLNHESSHQYSYFFDDHTPYFDILGENAPKNKRTN